MHEKILKIYEEDDYEWKGYKYRIHEMINPSDLIKNGKVKDRISKNMADYFLVNWGNKYEEYYSVEALKKFMNS